MKRRPVRRFWLLVAAGIVTAAVVATIALASSGGGSAQVGPMQLTLGDLKAFPIKTYSFEIEANTTWVRGGGASVGKPNPGALQFTKVVDASIDELITNMAKGKSFAKAELLVTLPTGEKLTYSMTGVYVTKVAEAGEAGGRPQDVVEVVYKTLQWQFGTATGKWDVPGGTIT